MSHCKGRACEAGPIGPCEAEGRRVSRRRFLGALAGLVAVLVSREATPDSPSGAKDDYLFFPPNRPRIIGLSHVYFPAEDLETKLQAAVDAANRRRQNEPDFTVMPLRAHKRALRASR